MRAAPLPKWLRLFLRTKPDVAPGNRLDWRSATTRCLSACSSAAWRCSRFYLETAFCVGIGGRCEPANKSGDTAHGHPVVRCHGGLRIGLIRNPTSTPEP